MGLTGDRMYRDYKSAKTDPTHVPSPNASFGKKKSGIPLILLFLYLILEYSRPQELLPFLRVLRLPTVTVILLALSILFSGGLRLREKQTVLFLSILGLMVIHGPIAVNNYWTLMIFLSMVMNFFVYLGFIHYVDDQEKYDRLLKIWIGVHVFLALVGIVKQGKGIGGFLADENDLCMTLNMIIPLSFFLAMSASGKKKIYYIFLTGLFLFVIILSESRGGFVGLVAAFIYCFLRTKKKVITAFIIGVLAMFAAIVAPPSYWGEVGSITEEGTQKGTGEERVYTWGIGWHMFLDNPILGVGQGNFPYVFGKYELEVTGSDEAFHGRSVAGRQAHSIYFTMLPELGIIGTGIIIGMIINIFKDLKAIRFRSSEQKNKDTSPISNNYYFLALGLEGALVAYLASGAFISILYYPNLWILMGFVLSLKKIAIQDSTDTHLSLSVFPLKT